MLFCTVRDEITMSGPPNRRKPFQGKKFHKDLREFKSQEIRRSLTHRARLRKGYFKLLEKEGLAPKPTESKSENDAINKEESSGDEKSTHGDEDDENEQHESRSAKKSGALVAQEDLVKTAPTRKQLNFAERAKIAKERKQQQKQERLARVQEKRQLLERKEQERIRKSQALQKKTRRGQPVMGPKINDLLDKIRNNQ